MFHVSVTGAPQTQRWRRIVKGLWTWFMWCVSSSTSKCMESDTRTRQTLRIDESRGSTEEPAAQATPLEEVFAIAALDPQRLARPRVALVCRVGPGSQDIAGSSGWVSLVLRFGIRKAPARQLFSNFTSERLRADVAFAASMRSKVCPSSRRQHMSSRGTPSLQCREIQVSGFSKSDR